MQLRWVAVVGQLLAIGIAYALLKIPLPMIGLLILVGFTASTNILIYCAIRRFGTHSASLLAKELLAKDSSDVGPSRLIPVRANALDSVHVPSYWLGLLLLVDVMTLTGLLYFSGGAVNPFACFYLANIVVGGLVLPAAWTWMLAVASVLGTTLLLAFAEPIPQMGVAFAEGVGLFSIPKQGALIAMTTCCGVVTHFMTVLVKERRSRESRLAEAEAQTERAQRVEALATLAAGAGHELASPLSTIAVVTKELARKLDRTQTDPSVRRDVDLIRSELDRCREVLQRMKSGAGEAAAEVMNQIGVEELVKTILEPLRRPDRVEVVIDPKIRSQSIQLPLQAVSQAIRNLVQNALDASPEPSQVALHVQQQDSNWQVLIIDQGSGMSEDVLRRIGQPFYTTKEVGQGMGLGVFLTRNVFAGLGGTVDFESTVGKGSTARVTFPQKRS
jgi:two-component system sensor histidine kinase RegB